MYGVKTHTVTLPFLPETRRSEKKERKELRQKERRKG